MWLKAIKRNLGKSKHVSVYLEGAVPAPGFTAPTTDLFSEEVMPEKKEKADEEVEGKSQEELLEVLHELVSAMDREDLIFLVNQTRVLIHNRKVREINKKILSSKTDERKQGKKSAGDTETPTVQKSIREVEIVERGDGKHFFIVVRGYRIYFTREEMRKLVKICQLAQNSTDASQRLYNWFKRFRSDLLVDGGIASARNPYLEDLYSKLISTYRVGEDD